MASDPSGRSYLVIGGDDGDLEAVAIALLELGDHADHLDVALLGAG